MSADTAPAYSRRDRIHEIIFEAETPAGKAFDVALLVAIVVSILAVCLESVATIRAHYGPALRALEWGITIFSSPSSISCGYTASASRGATL